MSTDDALRDYYAARAPEYDDWYLRKGRYSHGPEADSAWANELDQAAAWLAALPVSGEIVELAAGTGWWSSVLASRGELSLYDANSGPLAIAAERLRGLGLTARFEVRDAWVQPDRPADALFTGFWLSHIPRDRLGDFLTLCRRWLKPGGIFAFIDSRQDPQSSASNHPSPQDDRSIRRLNDGRKFTITKIFWQPDELRAALTSAGFEAIDIQHTNRFFVLGSAVAT